MLWFPDGPARKGFVIEQELPVDQFIRIKSRGANYRVSLILDEIHFFVGFVSLAIGSLCRSYFFRLPPSLPFLFFLPALAFVPLYFVHLILIFGGVRLFPETRAVQSIKRRPCQEADAIHYAAAFKERVVREGGIALIVSLSVFAIPLVMLAVRSVAFDTLLLLLSPVIIGFFMSQLSLWYKRPPFKEFYSRVVKTEFVGERGELNVPFVRALDSNEVGSDDDFGEESSTEAAPATRKQASVAGVSKIGNASWGHSLAREWKNGRRQQQKFRRIMKTVRKGRQKTRLLKLLVASLCFTVVGATLVYWPYFISRYEIKRLAKLSPSQAEVLCRRFDDEPLHFWSLRELSPQAATALAPHRGGVFFYQLDELTPELAAAFSTYQGSELSFGAVRTLSPEIAGNLAAYPGDLQFGGLQDFSPEAAAALASHQGGLRISGLEPPSPAVVEALNRYKGRLRFYFRSEWPPKAPKELPLATAEALAKRPGPLEVSGDVKITYEPLLDKLAGKRGDGGNEVQPE